MWAERSGGNSRGRLTVFPEYTRSNSNEQDLEVAILVLFPSKPSNYASFAVFLTAEKVYLIFC